MKWLMFLADSITQTCCWEIIVTARKRSLRRLCFYRCVSVHTGGGWYPSMHCRWYPSMPCSRSPGRWGGIPACLAGFEVHTRGGSWGGSGRGVSRPIPKGEVEGDLASWVSRPTSRGVPGSALGGGAVETPCDIGGTYPTGMHSCFSKDFPNTQFLICKYIV